MADDDPKPDTKPDTKPAEGNPPKDDPKPAEGDKKGQPAPAPDGDDLAAWKRHARHYERQAKEHETELAKHTAELEKLRDAQRSESEKALEKARRDGATEAEKQWKVRWQSERLRGEALRALSGKFTSPRLLLPHLDLDSIPVSDSGDVDAEALSAALDALAEEYPDQLTENGHSSSSHVPSTALGPRRTAPAGPAKPSLSAGSDLYAKRHQKAAT